VVPPRTPRRVRVVATQPIVHPYRPDAYRRRRRPGDKGHGRWRFVDDLGGRGTAIVREIAVCPGCV
jgi:hypothetical protein